MRPASAAAAFVLAAGPAAADPIGDTAWSLRVVAGNPTSPPCVARIQGPDVATSLIQNRSGRPVLLIARPEWSGSGKVAIAFSIDGAPAVMVEGAAAKTLILPPLLAPTVFERLTTARSIEWTLPGGRYRGDVAGLDQAWAALRACNAKAAAAAPQP